MMPATTADRFLLNLTLLIVLGVTISAWLIRYTDWFAEFSVLVALGGALTWVGIVAKLLPEERVKALQKRVDEILSSSTRLLACFAIVMGVLIFLATFIGTVDVRSEGITTEHLVWFDFQPTQLENPERLPAGGRLRQPRFTTWWNPKKERVKVSGYPSVEVTSHPLLLSRLYVPTTVLLAKPVVLLRPTDELAVFTSGLTLEIKAGGRTVKHAFDGHPVWIGCEEDVPIPARLVDAWTARAEKEELPALLAKWQAPRAVDLRLEPDMEIEVRVLRRGAPFSSRQPIRAVRRGHIREFPQVEEIDVPNPVRP